MTRTMYDSVDWAAIPAGAGMVAGYIDSIHYTWPPAAWARFPHAVKVRIATRSGTNDGHVGDCESGNMTAAQAVAWVRLRRSAGADPSIYCTTSLWPSVRAAFSAAGVGEPHWWIAHFDGDPAVPAGAVAKQYNSPPASGGDWDISAVADHWPGVDEEDDVSAQDVWNFPLEIPANMRGPNDPTHARAETQLGYANRFALAAYQTAQAALQTAQGLQAAVDTLANALATQQGTDPETLRTAVAAALRDGVAPAQVAMPAAEPVDPGA